MLLDPDAAYLDRNAVLRRLDESMATLEWAVRLVPDEWTHRAPTGRMSSEDGAWSVAMNLAHLCLYAERLPIPVLESILAGEDGVSGTWFGEPSPFEKAAIELAAAPLPAILQRLQTARSRHVDLALSFPESAWALPTTKAWGGNGYGPAAWSPARVIAKTFQHTWEHGNAILRVALFAPRDLVEE